MKKKKFKLLKKTIKKNTSRKKKISKFTKKFNSKEIFSGKPTKSQLREEFSDEHVEAILKRGKDRGFITYSEIISAFPHIEHNLVFLEDLYGRFENSGVDVLESKDLLDLEEKIKRQEHCTVCCTLTLRIIKTPNTIPYI